VFNAATAVRLTGATAADFVDGKLASP